MDSTILAYIAGFLDGDGSIFFQIVPRKDYTRKFQIRCSIAFYQKTQNVKILKWLKQNIKSGYIRNRKTGISDYTIVEPTEVEKISTNLQPYVKVKKKQIDLGLDILKELKSVKSDKEFLKICVLVDRFGKLNYSKKRKITYQKVKEHFESKALPL